MSTYIQSLSLSAILYRQIYPIRILTSPKVVRLRSEEMKGTHREEKIPFTGGVRFGSTKIIVRMTEVESMKSVKGNTTGLY